MYFTGLLFIPALSFSLSICVSIYLFVGSREWTPELNPKEFKLPFNQACQPNVLTQLGRYRAN